MPISKFFECYYDSGRKCFWIQNDRMQWIEVSLEILKLKLKEAGGGTVRPVGESLSEIDRYIANLITSKDVFYAGPLAGYKTGVIEQLGSRILVTTQPEIIHGVKGEWPTLKSFLVNLLGEEQLPFLYGWLQMAIGCLHSGNHRPGQCLVIAGPADCGKSFLQNRITSLLGGRAAKPYLFMAGKSSFNRELFGAEHLMLEDVMSHIDANSRRALGSSTKEFTVNEVQCCHGKNREGINVKPLWRVSITVNDDPEDLMVIPAMRDSLVDKFIILKAVDAKIPKEGREHFVEQIEKELKHFVWFLMMEWKIPEHLVSRRFGITHYHHPEILAAINEMSAEAELLSYIDSSLFLSGEKVWKGSPHDFIERMTLGGSRAIERLLSSPTRTGKLLSRLAKDYPKRFSSDRNKSTRFWTIKRDENGEKNHQNGVMKIDEVTLQNLGDTCSGVVSPSQLLDNQDINLGR